MHLCGESQLQNTACSEARNEDVAMKEKKPRVLENI